MVADMAAAGVAAAVAGELKAMEVERCKEVPEVSGGAGVAPAGVLLLTKKRTFFPQKKSTTNSCSKPALFWKKQTKKNPQKNFPTPPNTLKWWYYYCTSKIKTNKKWPKKNQIKFPEKKIRILLLPKTTPKIPQKLQKILPHTTIFFFTSNEQDTRKKKK